MSNRIINWLVWTVIAILAVPTFIMIAGITWHMLYLTLVEIFK